MSANYSLHQHQLEEMAVSLAGLRGETCDPVTISMETGRLCGVLARLEASAAGGNPVRVFSSPARTEIGGNHTDHQRGCVLCACGRSGYPGGGSRERIRKKWCCRPRVWDRRIRWICGSPNRSRTKPAILPR
jgi:hypothetical protein